MGEHGKQKCYVDTWVSVSYDYADSPYLSGINSKTQPAAWNCGKGED